MGREYGMIPGMLGEPLMQANFNGKILWMNSRPYVGAEAFHRVIPTATLPTVIEASQQMGDFLRTGGLISNQKGILESPLQDPNSLCAVERRAAGLASGTLKDFRLFYRIRLNYELHDEDLMVLVGNDVVDRMTFEMNPSRVLLLQDGHRIIPQNGPILRLFDVVGNNIAGKVAKVSPDVPVYWTGYARQLMLDLIAEKSGILKPTYA